MEKVLVTCVMLMCNICMQYIVLILLSVELGIIVNKIISRNNKRFVLIGKFGYTLLKFVHVELTYFLTQHKITFIVLKICISRMMVTQRLQ